MYLGLIKKIGTGYFNEKIFPTVKEYRSYNRHKIPFGIKKYGNQSVFELDLSEALRIIAIGKLRSGKTFLMRSLMDRLKLANANIFVPSDVKNEFQSSIKPVQDKFAKKLMVNEQPQGMEMKSYRPTFFRDLIDPEDKETNQSIKLPKNNKWLSISPRTIKKKDFMTLFNADQLRQNDRTNLDILYTYVKKYKNSTVGVDINSFLEAIEEIDVFNEQQRIPLRRRFYTLQNSDFFMPDYQIDITTDLVEGKAVTINMQDFNTFSKGNYGFPFVLFSVLLRNVLEARRSGKLENNLWVFIDEMPRFVPKHSTLCSSLDVQESVDVDGAYGINYFFATQWFSSVPENIINQSRYILVPFSIATQELKEIMKNVGIFDVPQTAQREAADLKRKMDKYEWLVIDMNTMEYNIIKPLPPLSWHEETRN